MIFTVVITSLAVFNALFVPLYLEHQITFHPDTVPIQMAGGLQSVHNCARMRCTGNLRSEQLRRMPLFKQECMCAATASIRWWEP